MDRDRVGAWIATQPHLPVLKELVAGYDSALADAANLRHELGKLADLRASAESRLATAVEDADRLARWIIDHPSGDPTEVLTLHDRSKP